MCSINVNHHYSEKYLSRVYADPICHAIYRQDNLINRQIPEERRENEMLHLVIRAQEHYLALYYMGFHYEQRQNWNKALEYYQRCLQKKQFVDAYLNLVMILMRFGMMKEVEQFLQQAEINKIDGDIRIQNMLGVFIIHINFQKRSNIILG